MISRATKLLLSPSVSRARPPGMGQVKRLGGESAVLFIKDEGTKFSDITRKEMALGEGKNSTSKLEALRRHLYSHKVPEGGVLGQLSTTPRRQRRFSLFLFRLQITSDTNGDVRERNFNCRIPPRDVVQLIRLDVHEGTNCGVLCD